MRMRADLPTLFDIAKTGKIKQWRISVTDESGAVEVKVEHGFTDGAKTTSVGTIAAGKNIGRANETTPWEQAEAEAKAAWQKKKDKGYVEDINHAQEKTVERLPMLAHKFSERGHAILFPAMGQPKLNGVRCLVTKLAEGQIEYRSRGGNLFTALSHLVEHHNRVMAVGQTLDGELFNPSYSLQQIVSMVKPGNTPDPKTVEIQHWVYDLADERMNFEARIALLREMLTAYPGTAGALVLVETAEIAGAEDVLPLHQRFTQASFEGTMIRNRIGGYEFKHRSNHLQKFKDFIDAEFRVTGVVEATGKSAGQAVLVCVTKDGKEFTVRCEGTDAYRREQWVKRDKLIGKTLTVRLQGYTDGGIPFFHVGVAIREDWDK